MTSGFPNALVNQRGRTDTRQTRLTTNQPASQSDSTQLGINGLYKIVHGLSIAAEMYDLERPLSKTQGQ